MAARVTEALERPSRMWPVNGIETSAPSGHAQQAQPERRLRDPEVVLQPRDVRDPRSHHRAVDREDRERGQARRHTAIVRVPPASARRSRQGGQADGIRPLHPEIGGRPHGRATALRDRAELPSADASRCGASAKTTVPSTAAAKTIREAASAGE